MMFKNQKKKAQSHNELHKFFMGNSKTATNKKGNNNDKSLA